MFGIINILLLLLCQSSKTRACYYVFCQPSSIIYSSLKHLSTLKSNKNSYMRFCTFLLCDRISNLMNCSGNYILCKGLFRQPRGSPSIPEDLAEGLPALYGVSTTDTGPAPCFVPPVAAILFRSLPSVGLGQL